VSQQNCLIMFRCTVAPRYNTVPRSAKKSFDISIFLMSFDESARIARTILHSRIVRIIQTDTGLCCNFSKGWTNSTNLVFILGSFPKDSLTLTHTVIYLFNVVACKLYVKCFMMIRFFFVMSFNFFSFFINFTQTHTIIYFILFFPLLV
jgi:hypothetical protein